MYTVALKSGINFIIKASEMFTHKGCVIFIDDNAYFVAIYPIEEISYAVKKDV